MADTTGSVVDEVDTPSRLGVVIWVHRDTKLEDAQIVFEEQFAKAKQKLGDSTAEPSS